MLHEASCPLRTQVMQMNLEYQQRAWPDPPCTPAPAINQAANAPERPERLVPQEESQWLAMHPSCEGCQEKVWAIQIGDKTLSLNEFWGLILDP